MSKLETSKALLVINSFLGATSSVVDMTSSSSRSLYPGREMRRKMPSRKGSGVMLVRQESHS